MNGELERIRHTLAHVLAMAVREYDSEVKLAIGPVIETGFYYDFEFSEGKTLGDIDLPKLEKKMREILKRGFTPKCREVNEKEVRDLFKNQPYKLELIDEIITAGEKVTVYEIGDFVDLCEGPHIKDSKEIAPDVFTLMSVAGAYWRGDEKNTMLTRIYGAAFETKRELNIFLTQLEEAKKRDHKKLGKELGLFTFSDLVGAGLPLFTPKGTVIRQELEQFISELNKKHGYQQVWIPHLAKPELYKISGHWDKFAEDLFHVRGAEDEFVIKPMNCPHHTQIYASQARSYRDLPIRFYENTTVYRDEKSGQLGGLTRVRSITQDDGHVFLRPDQIEQEFKIILDIQQHLLEKVDLNNYWVSLSLRDPHNKEAYLGDDSVWEKAQKTMEDILKKNNIQYKTIEGEAAFYGPKMDLMVKDSIGREWQLSTAQLDFNMPGRFGLEYTAEDGSKQTPLMIHRAFMGSTERFMGVLIEHYAGVFPLWLSPVQVKVLPISEDHKLYAQEVATLLRESDIRVELNENDETLGKKIRNAKLEKIPVFLVIGDEEMKGKTVTAEYRDGKSEKEVKLELVIEKLLEQIKNRTA